MSVETYHCRRCGAQFGIAGESTGSLEDLQAEEFYDEEVAYHEGAHCPAVPGTKGRWTPKRSEALRKQREHGQRLRDQLQWLAPRPPMWPIDDPVQTINPARDSKPKARLRQELR